MATENSAQALESILTYVGRDPGLYRRLPAADMLAGQQGGRDMNSAIGDAIDATGVNADGRITAEDVMQVSDHIRAHPALYGLFVLGHGDDNNNFETGFHLVQDDGGVLQFQGRDYVDTVADAIYHIGFTYADGRLRNEDGNANEKIDDVAGWLNFFLNGTNIVYGSDAAETLGSGAYSDSLAIARNEVFEAGAGDDHVWADAGDDTVHAGTGNDRVGGGTGNDWIDGDHGNDALSGDDGWDRIFGGNGRDTINGGNHGDRLYGGRHDDRVWGDAGNDMVDGGTGNDELGGGTGNDTLFGGAGDDRLYGDAGRDTLHGDDGADQMGGGGDADVIFGGNGDDRIGGGDGADRIFGGLGDDALFGDDAGDLIIGGDGNDELGGGGGNDRLYGGAQDDLVFGGEGHDLIGGNDQDDVLHGQNGNDRLYGGDGADTIYGGEGRDTFMGGAGADLMEAWETTQVRDVFIFKPADTGVTRDQRDTISGFGAGTDKIDLTGYGGLRWVDDAAFAGDGTAEVGFLGRLVLIDRDGDGQIDGIIVVNYVDELTQGDFIL